MNLPISFDDVSYFNNEYRGDLIVTSDVLYYFPHTRVKYAGYSEEIGGKDAMVLFSALGNFVPILGTVPWIRVIAVKGLKVGKLIKKTVRPSINSPKIKELGLWKSNSTNEGLQ